VTVEQVSLEHTSVFPCQYRSTSASYSFIHQRPTWRNLSENVSDIK